MPWRSSMGPRTGPPDVHAHQRRYTQERSEEPDVFPGYFPTILTWNPKFPWQPPKSFFRDIIPVEVLEVLELNSADSASKLHHGQQFNQWIKRKKCLTTKKWLERRQTSFWFGCLIFRSRRVGLYWMYTKSRSITMGCRRSNHLTQTNWCSVSSTTVI